MSEDNNDKSYDGVNLSDDDLSFSRLSRLVLNATLILSLSLLFITMISSPKNSTPVPIFKSLENTATFEEAVENQVDHLRKGLNNTNDRIDDLKFSITNSSNILGFVVAFFGFLITVLILYITMRARAESVSIALNQAEKIWGEKLSEFEKKVDIVYEISEHSKKKISEIDEKISKVDMISRESPKAKGPYALSENEIKIRAFEANSKPEHKRDSEDWRSIALFGVNNKEITSKSAQAFERAALLNENLPGKAIDAFNAGHTYAEAGFMDRSAENYDALFRWGNKSNDSEVQKFVAMSLNNMGLGYLHDVKEKNIDKAKEIFDKLIKWGSKINNPYVKKQICDAWYNYACTYSINNELSEAIKSLNKSFGYKNFPNIKFVNEDKDLDNIRESNEFKEFMEKAFPSKIEKSQAKKKPKPKPKV